VVSSPPSHISMLQNRSHIILLVLCLNAVIFSFGCQSPEGDEKPLPTKESETDFCEKYPRLANVQDTIAFINDVRRFVAQRADLGVLPNFLCDSFASIPIQNFQPDDFLKAFEEDMGVAKCGLVSQLMVKILLLNGIDAYTYNFGFENSWLAHVVVLAKKDQQLFVFDPHINYQLLDSNGNNLSLKRLLFQIANDSINATFSNDTVWADLLVDWTQLNPTQKRFVNSTECSQFSGKWQHLRDSIYKQPYPRGYLPERETTCFNFIEKFEEELQQKTEYNKLVEGFALKINEINGAEDSQKINREIDSLISELF